METNNAPYYFQHIIATIKKIHTLLASRETHFTQIDIFLTKYKIEKVRYIYLGAKKRIFKVDFLNLPLCKCMYTYSHKMSL